MPGVLTIEAIAQCGAVAVLADEANRGKIPFFAGIDDCRFKRVVEPGDVSTLECEFLRVRGPIAKGQGRALVGDDVAVEAMLTVFVGTEMIGDGAAAPRHDHRARRLRARPRRHERRARAVRRHVRRVDHRAHRHPRAPDRRGREALSDLAMPACAAGARAGRRDGTGHRPPDRRDRDAGHDVPLDRGDPRRPARREGRGRLRPLRRLHRLHVRARAGLRDAARRASRSARSSSAATCSPASSTGPTARRSSSSATAPARSCSSRSEEAGFLGFELGADGAGGENLWLPGSGSREFRGSGPAVKMNGREVFKFATRDSRPVGGGRARSNAGKASTTSTSTSRIRRTFGSSTTQPRSSGSRLIGWWSMSTVTATRLPARSRSRSPMHRRTGGFGRVASCS